MLKKNIRQLCSFFHLTLLKKANDCVSKGSRLIIFWQKPQLEGNFFYLSVFFLVVWSILFLKFTFRRWLIPPLQVLIDPKTWHQSEPNYNFWKVFDFVMSSLARQTCKRWSCPRFGKSEIRELLSANSQCEFSSSWEKKDNELEEKPRFFFFF